MTLDPRVPRASFTLHWLQESTNILLELGLWHLQTERSVGNTALPVQYRVI